MINVQGSNVELADQYIRESKEFKDIFVSHEIDDDPDQYIQTASFPFILDDKNRIRFGCQMIVMTFFLCCFFSFSVCLSVCPSFVPSFFWQIGLEPNRDEFVRPFFVKWFPGYQG